MQGSHALQIAGLGGIVTLHHLGHLLLDTPEPPKPSMRSITKYKEVLVVWFSHTPVEFLVLFWFTLTFLWWNSSNLLQWNSKKIEQVEILMENVLLSRARCSCHLKTRNLSYWWQHKLLSMTQCLNSRPSIIKRHNWMLNNLSWYRFDKDALFVWLEPVFGSKNNVYDDKRRILIPTSSTHPK